MRFTRLGTVPDFANQAVADAYYVLSDPQRRREYDSLYSTRSHNEYTADPGPGTSANANFFDAFASMFGGGAAKGTGQSTAEDFTNEERPNAEYVFGDVFEEVRIFVIAYPVRCLISCRRRCFDLR